MSSQDTDVPPVTSILVDHRSPDPGRQKISQPWKKPFLELLDFLKDVDVSQPTPRLDGQCLCFQPSHDLSKISKIFISVSAPFFQDHIDLERFPCQDSHNVRTAITKLEEYADHVLRRIHRFRDRLIERNIVQDSQPFLQVDLFTCPVCLGPLDSCIDCDAVVACSNPNCQGSLAIDCEFCYDHSRMSCRTCLATNDPFPSLVRCPICESWCCREDLDWCVGLIKDPALGTKELAELSRECKWDNETIVRSHPPKPGPCAFCIERDHSLDWTPCRNRGDLDSSDREPDGCPSQTPLMVSYGLRAAYCHECVGQNPGYRCACGIGWLCETCFTIKNKTRDYPYFITCPRCAVDYCTNPASRCGNYIEICRGCKGAILCNDCHEEEALPGDIQTTKPRPRQIVFNSICSYCEAWSCGECRASPRSATCFFCDEWFCFGCVSDQEHSVIEKCPSCTLYICVDCSMEHESCLDAVLLRDGLRQEGVDDV